MKLCCYHSSIIGGKCPQANQSYSRLPIALAYLFNEKNFEKKSFEKIVIIKVGSASFLVTTFNTFPSYNSRLRYGDCHCGKSIKDINQRIAQNIWHFLNCGIWSQSGWVLRDWYGQYLNYTNLFRLCKNVIMSLSLEVLSRACGPCATGLVSSGAWTKKLGGKFASGGLH